MYQVQLITKQKGKIKDIKIPSHIHPSPLHPNVILWDLHTLKNIEYAQNHFLKLVQVEANQHVMVP